MRQSGDIAALAAQRTGHVGRAITGEHLLLHHFEQVVERDAEAHVGNDLAQGDTAE